jgi:signal transduction histidine kinase
MSASQFPIPDGMLPPIRTDQAHSVQFYDEDSGMIASVCDYFEEVLEERNSALVVATPSHREGIKAKLAERGLNVEQATREGRYIELDAEETLAQFIQEGWPDPERYKQTVGKMITRVRSAARGNPPRLAVFGEMVALLWAQGKKDTALRLEELWNELQKTETFTLRCAYPMRGFDRKEDAEGFLAICQGHSHVIPAEGFTSLGTEDARLRSVSQLQQKARALELEMAQGNEARLTLQRQQTLLQEQAEILVAANEGLRELSARLLKVQDEERRRIAQDLHASTGQNLALLSMNLSALESEAALFSPQLAKRLEENRHIVRKISNELRTLSYLLHPPLLEEVGLESALRLYIDDFHQRSNIAVSLEVPANFGRLPRATELAVFRMIQECLTNIHRHSGSALAAIQMARSSGDIRVTVRDDGKGIAPEKLAKLAVAGETGVGLAGIRERARSLGGELQIHSDGNGTEIRIIIPTAG